MIKIKKIILLSIFLLFNSFVVAQECDPKGDINGDGKLNSDDRELLNQILLGEVEKGDCADIDVDGDIDYEDFELQYKLITSAPGYEGAVSMILKEDFSQDYQDNLIKLESISYDQPRDFAGYSMIIISVNGKQIPIRVSNELYNSPYPEIMPTIYEQGLKILVVMFNEEQVHLSISRGEEQVVTKEIDFQSRLPAVLQGNIKEIEQNDEADLRFYVDIENLKLIVINKNTNERQESNLQKETVNMKNLGELSDNYETVLKGAFSYKNKVYEISVFTSNYFYSKMATLTILNALGKPRITLYPYGCDIGIGDTLQYPEEEGVISGKYRYSNMKNAYYIKINSVDEKGASFIVNDEITPFLNNEKNYYQLTGPYATESSYIYLTEITKKNNVFYARFCLIENDELNLIPIINQPENIITKEKIIASDCDGCLTLDGCFTIGTRIGYNYCDESKKMQPQKYENTFCKNNFECFTNFCVNNRCTNLSMWNKFLLWFKKIFG